MQLPRLNKRMQLTLICPGRETLSAEVTLTRTSTVAGPHWSASTSVLRGTDLVAHATGNHANERGALLEAAEWLRSTFGASTTCLGSTVTIVGVSPSLRAVA